MSTDIPVVTNRIPMELARLVLGADLQLVAVRRKGSIALDPIPVHIEAYDGDGGELGTLAVLSGVTGTVDGATLTLAADTARALWPELVHAPQGRPARVA